MSIVQKQEFAVSNYKNKFNCCQSVISAFMKEGHDYAKEHNLFQTKCAKFIEDSVTITEELIKD